MSEEKNNCRLLFYCDGEPCKYYERGLFFCRHESANLCYNKKAWAEKIEELKLDVDKEGK